MRGRSVPKAGRIVLASPDAPAAQALIAGRSVHDGFGVDDSAWTVDHLVCVGTVAAPASYAAAIDLTLRGADVVADVADELVDAFLDELARAGLTPWTPPAGKLGNGTRTLLDELAGGASIAAAARRCHMSERSAHRRLADARVTLGLTTTAEVIATWSARRGNRADST
jgi:hypothetical protein